MTFLHHSCICDVLAMVHFHLELCANEPCLPKLPLTEWSITATGKEADTLVSTPSLRLLPPFLPFSSPPWGRFFTSNTVYPLLLAPAKSLESSCWHCLLSIMRCLGRCCAVWWTHGTYFAHHLSTSLSPKNILPHFWSWILPASLLMIN